MLDGKGLKGREAQNGVLVNGADERHDQRLHGHATTRATASSSSTSTATRSTNLIAEHDRRLRHLRLQLQGRHDVELRGLLQQRRGLLHRPDAAAGASRSARSSRTSTSWGNVLGYSGTNIALRDDHEVASSSTTASASSRTRSTPRSSRRRRTTSSPTTTSSGTTSTTTRAPRSSSTRARPTACPTRSASGILLFGGRDTRVENNRIYGNYLIGVGVLAAVLLKQDRTLRDARAATRSRGNEFGLGGADLNGRDLFYDGNGSGNCFENNTAPSPNVPADNSTFAACPVTAEHVQRGRAQRGLGLGGRHATRPTGSATPHKPITASRRSSTGRDVPEPEVK